MKSALARLAARQGAPVSYARNGGGSSVLSTPLRGGRSGMDAYVSTYRYSGTVHAIVETLVTSTAMTTWNLYKKPTDNRVRYTTGDQGSDQRTQVLQNAALQLWSNPNPFQTRYEFCEAFQQHLELCGEAWWVLGRDGTSFPTSMWCVNPAKMEPVPSEANFLAGYVYHGPNGELVPLELDDVIFIRIPDPGDPYRGMSPIASIMPNIEGMRHATEYQRNFFYNGAQPDGLIQVDHRLSDEEFDELSARWREGHLGIARAHRVAFLENNATWVPNAMTHRDMEFATLRTMSRDEIREAFGLHKSMIGNSDDVNRANAQTAQEVFGQWKILPRLNRIKEALNSRLLPMFGTSGQGIEFDYDNPLPDDREADNAELTAKTTAAAALVDAGFDPHDALEVVGLPDMDVQEKATQQPALPPGWVAAPPAQPDQQLNGELADILHGTWSSMNMNGHTRA